MASQRDIKRRIESVRNTRKITRAMELVASAKLRRAQDRIEALRPYARALREQMAQAARETVALRNFPLLAEREEIKRAAIVTITGDRGLAGAFNVNILRAGFAADDRFRVDGARRRRVRRRRQEGLGHAALPLEGDRRDVRGLLGQPQLSTTPTGSPTTWSTSTPPRRSTGSSWSTTPSSR